MWTIGEYKTIGLYLRYIPVRRRSEKNSTDLNRRQVIVSVYCSREVTLIDSDLDTLYFYIIEVIELLYIELLITFVSHCSESA